MVIRLLEKKEKQLKTKKSNATTLKYNYVPGPKSGKSCREIFLF